MEAWVKVYHDMSDHPKTYALADTLKVEQFAAVGIVVCLWTWAVIHAPDGDLERFPDAAIARACHWHKSAAGLAKALQECGFLDGRRIHDWDEYASALMDAVEVHKEKTRKRVEAYRERKRTADALQDEESNVTGNADVTLPVTGCNVTGNADVTPGNALRTRTRTRYIEDGDIRAREDSCRSPEIGALVTSCLKSMSPKAWAELDSWLEKLPEALVAWAVQTACDHGADNWAYVSKVLSGLSAAGIRTVEDAEKRSEEHRRRRSGGQAKTVIAQQYTQRDYKGEPEINDLLDWLAEDREKEVGTA